jgi:hypothetical protein
MRSTPSARPVDVSPVAISQFRCGELRDQAREVFKVPDGDDPVTSHLVHVHRADHDSTASSRSAH